MDLDTILKKITPKEQNYVLGLIRKDSFREDQPMALEKILSKLTPKERRYVLGLIERDPLTGIYNRRKFDHDVALVLSMSDRSSKGASLLLADIDYFKRFNDEHGHQEGDRVLKTVTQAIIVSLRNYDKLHIYRYGGEEFVIMLPNTNIDDARIIAERLRKHVKSTSGVTVSIGESHYKEIAQNLAELVNRADKALYKAKETGRDRVVIFCEDP